jgi:superfamily I DNA/RNA helicase
VVGDPDQNLFQWRGSDPEVFVEPAVPADQVRILSQSYRIPRAVHATAVRWIERTPGRTPVEYHPRDEEGEVRRITASWANADPLLQDMRQYLDAGKSVMVLASCGYMLQPMLARLRREGIPFHNPYRRSDGSWNPLQSSRRRITPKDLVLAFLRMSEEGIWTAEDMGRWLEADVVYLFPDLSYAGMNEWIGGGSAAVRRLFYVGMTRAKESLILCQPVGSRSVIL